MADYDILLPEVLPEAPGVSEPLAIREIRSTVIDLCERAKIVKRTVTGVTVNINDHFIPIAPIANTTLVHLQSVSLEGRPLRKASADHLDLVWPDEMLVKALFKDYHSVGYNPSPGGWREYEQDRPDVFHLTFDDANGPRIRLVGTPLRAYTELLSYTVILKPSRTSTAFDTWVLERYFKAIAAGAIANLLSMPKKDWTDMGTAAVYRARYQERLSEAVGDGSRDFTRDDETTLRSAAYP